MFYVRFLWTMRLLPGWHHGTRVLCSVCVEFVLKHTNLRILSGELVCDRVDVCTCQSIAGQASNQLLSHCDCVRAIFLASFFFNMLSPRIS